MSLRAFESPWTDVAEHLRTTSGLAILPFGALEQHGPHLPLGTDTMTAVHVAAAIADELDAVLLPAVNYGDTWNNAGYPGTISLSPGTVTAIAVDIGRAVVASGGSALVIVNGDWGNRGPLYSAMRMLADEGIAAVTLDYPGMDAAVAQVRESVPAARGLNHAEEVETSILLNIAPELVRSDRYVAEYPEFPADFGIRPMQLHTFSASGVFGDPATASAEKGEAILVATIEASIQALNDFASSLAPRT
jgi:creatinine amidohydrolase